MKRVLTNLQVLEAVKLYSEQKLSTYAIANIYGCSGSTIQRELKKIGLIIRDQSHSTQKYHVNESIFDNIDTEHKAYWLGFLYADGNVSKTNRTRLSLAESDIEVVKKFSYFIFNENRVKLYNRPKSKINVQNLVYIDICNLHIAKQLTKLGCVPNKTLILTFPEWMDKKLYNHFVRGYFDGDGCLSNYKGKIKSKGKLTKGIIIGESNKSAFSILSTKEFCNSLQNIFLLININSSLSKRYKYRDSNNFTLNVGGNRQIERLMNWIYKDATIYMQRKYDKYLQLKKNNNCI